MIDFKQKMTEEEQILSGEIQPNKKIKKIIIYLGAALIFISLFAGKILISSQNAGGEWFRNSIFGRLAHLAETATRPLQGEKNDRINVLLLGMGGKNHDGAYLTDTMILVSFKPSTKQVAMLSIPRDLTVPMNNGSWRKINNINAFAEQKDPGSGGKVTSETVGELLQIPINYYVRADFDGFANVVDEMGGINVYVENTLDDYNYPILGEEDNPNYNARYEHLHLEKGWNKMDGQLALKYARSRHAAGAEGSDFARAKRQQIVLEAIKERVLSRHTLTNPSNLSRIINQLSEHIDTNLTISEMVKLWGMFKGTEKGQIINKVLDNGPGGYLVNGRGLDGAYILSPRTGNFNEIRKLVQNIFNPNEESTIRNQEKSIPLSQGTSSEAELPKNKEIKKITEKTSVEIINGTFISGLASTQSIALKEKGFIINKVGNAPERNFTQTMVYDLTYGEKNTSLEILKQVSGAQTSFSWPDWLKEKISAYSEDANAPDFILILGENSGGAKK